jgi:DNA-binding protein HU-beta
LPRKKLHPMNKAELVNEVQRLLGDGTSRAAAERAADSVLAGIKRGLKRDSEVHLVGFGTFTVAQRSARKGFNPHTRQPMKIAAMKLVRFKAGANLRGLR